MCVCVCCVSIATEICVLDSFCIQILSVLSVNLYNDPKLKRKIMSVGGSYLQPQDKLFCVVRSDQNEHLKEIYTVKCCVNFMSNFEVGFVNLNILA